MLKMPIFFWSMKLSNIRLASICTWMLSREGPLISSHLFIASTNLGLNFRPGFELMLEQKACGIGRFSSMNVKAHRLLNNTTVVLIFNYFNFIHSSAGLSFSLSLSLSLSLSFSHTHMHIHTLSHTPSLLHAYIRPLNHRGFRPPYKSKKLFLNSLSKFFLLEFFFC